MAGALGDGGPSSGPLLVGGFGAVPPNELSEGLVTRMAGNAPPDVAGVENALEFAGEESAGLDCGRVIPSGLDGLFDIEPVVAKGLLG